MGLLKDDLHSKVANISLVFLAFVVALFVMKTLASVVIPIVIAVFLFVFLNPLLTRCDKARIPKTISMIIALMVVLVIFVGFFYSFFAVLNVLTEKDKLLFYVTRVNDLDAMLTIKLRQVFNMSAEDMPSMLKWLNFDWYGILTAFVATASSKFVSILGDALLIFLYLMFIILERSTILPKLAVALPEDKGKQLIDIVGRMNRQTSKYLLLKVVISAATGVMFYIVSIIVGLDFPLVWGLLAFLLNFIPTIGSIVASVLVIFMSMIQFMPEWNRIVLIALMYISVEMVLGNIIDPKLQGVQLNISPLFILISLSVWGYMWGPVGMFLAVPLTSITQVICANIPTLKPISVLLSSGIGYAREEEKRRKRVNVRRKK